MRSTIKKYNELVFLLVGTIEAAILIKYYTNPPLKLYAYGFAFIFGVGCNYFVTNELFNKNSKIKIVTLTVLPILFTFVFPVLYRPVALFIPLIYLIGFGMYSYFYQSGIKPKLLNLAAILLSGSIMIMLAVVLPQIENNQKLISFAIPESKEVGNKLVPINFSNKAPINLHGKITVIDFWATWCKPCIVQFDELELLEEEYKSSNDVNIYAVNTSFGHDNQSKVEKFVLKNKLDFDVLYDSAGTFSNTLLVDVLPTTIVIDSKGIVRYRTVGLNTSKEGFVKEISTVIEKLQKEETQ